MIRPFKRGWLQDACPMADILTELTGQLDELKMYKKDAMEDLGSA